MKLSSFETKRILLISQTFYSEIENAELFCQVYKIKFKIKFVKSHQIPLYNTVHVLLNKPFILKDFIFKIIKDIVNETTSIIKTIDFKNHRFSKRSVLRRPFLKNELFKKNDRF